jgi:hypothetical protein
VKTAAKKSMHVVASVEGGWSVRQYGAARAMKKFTTQDAAVKFAKRLAKKVRTELYIHRRDGTIRATDNYEQNPSASGIRR